MKLPVSKLFSRYFVQPLARADGWDVSQVGFHARIIRSKQRVFHTYLFSWASYPHKPFDERKDVIADTFTIDPGPWMFFIDFRQYPQLMFMEKIEMVGFSMVIFPYLDSYTGRPPGAVITIVTPLDQPSESLRAASGASPDRTYGWRSIGPDYDRDDRVEGHWYTIALPLV